MKKIILGFLFSIFISPAFAITDCSGSITTGGVSQSVITVSQFTKGFILEVGQGDSNTDSICFSFTSTNATCGNAGVYSLNPSTATAAGGSFSTPNWFPISLNVYIYGATTGDKFKCSVQ